MNSPENSKRTADATPIAALGMLLLLVTAAATAGEADLALRTVVSPAGPYYPGQTAQITFTVTNLGPDVAGGDVPGDPAFPPVQVFSIIRVNDAYRVPLVIYPRDAAACPVELASYDPIPGDRAGLIEVVHLPRILVGESRSCTVDVYIDLTQATSIDATWRAVSRLDVDPNSTNSSSTTVFGFAAISVPSLTYQALWVLSLGVLLIASSNQRRRP